LVITFSCCKRSPQLILNIDSKYKGWIYLIPAKVSENEVHEIKANSFGIVYFSDSLYSQGSEVNLVIKINDTLNSRRLIKIHDLSFYPSNSSYKIMYKKFYFPLTNAEKNKTGDSLYTYKQDAYNINYVNEFEYYFLTGVIDSNLIKKW
jgi:ribosomal protein L30/L7E